MVFQFYSFKNVFTNYTLKLILWSLPDFNYFWKMNKKTLVIGASTNPNRYSNIAINRLLEKSIEVCAIGNREGEVAGVKIFNSKEFYKDIHTVTLYLNAKNQEDYYDYILALKPKRVIFNPGAENSEFEKLLAENNINFEEACTLVLLSIGKY